MNKITETKYVAAARWHRLRSRVSSHHLRVELGETAKLALPIVLTQVGQIAMMTTDLAFIGRLGSEALAAAALATRIYLVIFTFGTGLLAAIVPLAAQGFGADNLAVVQRSLRMGLWMAILLSLPIMAFAVRGEQILLAFGQIPNAASLAQQYLFGLAWGVAPALCFEAIRNFMGALNRPEPALWVVIVVIPINALLVYLLVHGVWGLPRLELFGAGLATALVNCGTFSAGLWFATMRRPFRDCQVLAHIWRFDWTSMRQLIVIGMPISIASLVGYGLSSATTLLVGLINTSALAAHQIAAQVSATLFMISFGISTAAAVRVSNAVSRSDGSGIKRAGLVAMLLGIVIVAMLTLAVIAGRFEIAELFLGEAAGDAHATIRLAEKLLLVGSSFFIPDAAKTIAAGSLRGLKDTRVPLLFAGIAYWLIGFSLSYLLGLRIGLGAIGIWIGLSIGTTVYAALLVLRFQLLANRLPSEPVFDRVKQG
nr:MATE family efflux transporter [Bradyrhizobium diazoefficiens]